MDFLKDFGVKPLLLAAQVVNFFILLIILKKFLYGPILKVLAERRKKIEDSLKNADEIERKLTEANEKYEKILTEAVNESQKILDQTKLAAAQILDDAKQGAIEIANKANEQILEATKAEQAKMMEQVKAEAFGLGAAIFRKLTGKEITKEDQKRLYEREVKNLS